MAKVTKTPFGTTRRGENVDLWTLEAGAYAAQVLTYGGILRSFAVPAPEGARDIVLGCDTLAQYEAQDKYLGALVGRVANRIGGAAFDLNGVHYPLAANSGPNCLHGGVRGFDQAVWTAREQDGALVLTLTSPDGEEGFPGTLAVQVTYSLTGDGALALDYEAVSDADTLCNLTNHSYFNLLGHRAGTLAGQSVQIWADAITETDGDSTPTGTLLPVEGTPFDLRRPRDFLEGLAMDHPQLSWATGTTTTSPSTPPRRPPWPRRPGSPAAGWRWSASPPSRGSSCTPPTTWTAPPARTGPPTAPGRPSAWRPRAGPTPSTTTISPPRSSGRGRPTATARLSGDGADLTVSSGREQRAALGPALRGQGPVFMSSADRRAVQKS